MLKTRSRVPPGGWQFVESKVGWQMPPEARGQAFDEAVEAIRKMRVLNHGRFPELSTNPTAIGNELDQFTCIRLAGDPEWCKPDFLKPQAAPPKTFRLLPQPRPRAGQAENVAGASNPSFIRNTIAGIGLYLDWFGTGTPVDVLKAEHRAAICVQCPKNVKGNLAQRFTASVSKEIMAVMRILKERNLQTSRDGDLGVCNACDCPMTAKVWSPLDIIQKHMRPEAKAALWENCWITHE